MSKKFCLIFMTYHFIQVDKTSWTYSIAVKQGRDLHPRATKAIIWVHMKVNYYGRALLLSPHYQGCRSGFGYFGRIRIRVSKKRSDPVFKIWLDPVPVWISIFKIPLKSNFSSIFIDQSCIRVVFWWLESGPGFFLTVGSVSRSGFFLSRADPDPCHLHPDPQPRRKAPVGQGAKAIPPK